MRAIHGAFLCCALTLAGCATAPPPPPVPVETPATGELSILRRELFAIRRLLLRGDEAGASARLDALDLRIRQAGLPSDETARLLDATDQLRGQLGSVVHLPEVQDVDPFLDETWWSPSTVQRQEVQTWQKHFEERDARGVAIWVGRVEPHAREMQEILRSLGLPGELWVLTLLESGGIPEAQSGEGAAGPWQLVANTARYLGLLITEDRDERRDWMLATEAAGTYLLELHDTFGDGLLALAAFNCGPGRVQRQIDADGTRDFWELNLPPETRDYVPRVVALSATVAADTTLAEDLPETRMDRLVLPYPVEVKDLAAVLSLDEADLRDANPSWLRDRTPDDGHPATVRVSQSQVPQLVEGFAAASIPRAGPRSSGTVITVASGDTLWGISRKHGAKLSELLKVNGLTGKEVLRPGQTIRVP